MTASALSPASPLSSPSSTPTPLFTPPPALADAHLPDLLSQCIHCGLCLPACPTYSVFQTEMDSPRGRIALINAASTGRIAVDDIFREHLELCLGCRACETACPSGVQYGLLYEAARVAIEETRTPGPVETAVRRLTLRELLPHVGRLRVLAWFLWLYEAIGLQALIRRFKLLPKGLAGMEALLPPLTPARPDYRQPAPAVGPKRGDVALLVGCIQDAFLANVNAATVRVLQRNGYEVHFPPLQTCCGAAPLHIGEHRLTQELAQRNIDACADRDYVAVISNAGGCGATLKQYDHLLADDPLYAAKAREFVAKLKDISEFLAENLVATPTGELPITATYVDSCHLRHAQKVVRQPRQLLQAIPGLRLVDLRQPDMCCGSAGVYNIVQPETANQVLDAKLADVAATHAGTVVVTNTGCHMQLIYGVRKAGLSAEVVHLVELLDRSYAQESRS